MKAVIYARYSSDNQREESIEGQIRECTAFAEKNNITILRHFIDRAFSAKTDNRPEFQNMIKDSGKRLFEACTYCLDNCTNYGDTLVDVPALGQRICPASGISASYLMWAVQSTVVEKLLEKGLKPSVYISNHMPDAARINGEALENYEKYGF